MSGDESLLEQLPPEKLLDTRNTRVITPAIEMMEEVATVELYLEHERANRDRPGIVRHFTEQIDAIYEENGEIPPGEKDQEQESEGEHEGDNMSTADAETVSPMSPPEELLAYIHGLGNESDDEIASSPAPPTWDEL
ncbi:MULTISPECIES: hypothetical protein [Halobellus]|uniref:DUF8129 domain-containing protein n=1 Tax=Halobellus litoreus TaxID=755310 RepID=A0ABD6DZ56_9EURY|nr:hypothetical protein [Halobellus litoreus]